MRVTTISMLLGTLAVAGAAHATDQALVIGVNNYAGLRPGSSLNGCVPDAKLMEEKLKGYNFEVTLLTDDQATKAGILAAIAALKDKLSAKDKVVVYFAGHGTTDGDSSAAILPSDAKDTGEGSDIKTTELYEAVSALPAASRTLILDSCHSGGMIPMGARGKGMASKLKPRAYVRTSKLKTAASRARGGGGWDMPKNTKTWQLARVNGADNLDKTTKSENGEVVYFAAALQTQVANETQLDGVPHGVFTFNLAKKLDGKGDLWKDVQSAVAKGVQEATDGQQSPLLAPSKFLEQPLFQNGGAKAAESPDPAPAKDPQPQTTTTLADIYSAAAPDADLLKLEFEPAISPIKIGAKIKMKVTVGTQEGYLVVVDKDPVGKFQLLYPMEGGIDKSKVAGGTVVKMPADDAMAYTADAEGNDTVKAFLFQDKAKAEALLAALSGQRGRGATVRGMLGKGKGWNLVRVEDKPAPAPTPAAPATVKELVTCEIITQIAKDQQ